MNGCVSIYSDRSVYRYVENKYNSAVAGNFNMINFRFNVIYVFRLFCEVKIVLGSIQFYKLCKYIQQYAKSDKTLTNAKNC